MIGPSDMPYGDQTDCFVDDGRGGAIDPAGYDEVPCTRCDAPIPENMVGGVCRACAIEGMLEAPPVPHQPGSVESRQAAAALKVNLTRKRIAVLKAYAAAGWRGLSDRELAHALDTEPGSVTGHRHALMKIGFVKKDPTLWRHNRLMNGKVGVYVIEEEGRRALGRLGHCPSTTPRPATTPSGAKRGASLSPNSRAVS